MNKLFSCAAALLICIVFSPDAMSNEDAKETGKVSDLDQSVAELTSKVCEHKLITYECDECRYEVGFVRVPAAMQENGIFTTTKPTITKIAIPIPLTGEIRFDEQRSIQLSALVDGVVKNTFVTLGKSVTKGQPLVEIESTTIGDDQASYSEAQSLLALARKNLDRTELLYKENIASEKAYLQAKQELEAARIRASSALGKLNRLGAGGNTNSKLVLRAPLDGIVTTLRAVPGETTKIGDILVTVGDDSVMVMWADVYERDIAVIKNSQSSGQKLDAAVSVKAYPDKVFNGTLEVISPSINESSRTLKARIQVINEDRNLLAGMFATAKLYISGSEEAITLPKDSVFQDDGQSFVFIHYDNEYFVRRKVVPGNLVFNNIEIKEGITPEQVVAVDGAFLLKSDILRSKMGAGCAD